MTTHSYSPHGVFTAVISTSLGCILVWKKLLVMSSVAKTLPWPSVTFELNVRLDLSGEATTKSLSSLGTELVLQILGECARTVAVWVIRDDEGVGDIPGVRGGSGGSAGSSQ